MTELEAVTRFLETLENATNLLRGRLVEIKNKDLSLSADDLFSVNKAIKNTLWDDLYQPHRFRLRWSDNRYLYFEYSYPDEYNPGQERWECIVCIDCVSEDGGLKGMHVIMYDIMCGYNGYFKD